MLPKHDRTAIYWRSRHQLVMPAAIAEAIGSQLRGELLSVWFSCSFPKQALAKLESEDVGFVRRFRHIIR
jgi:hypothetical protein